MSDPDSISPSSADHGNFDVSPDGEIVAIGVVGMYGTEGLQSSIRALAWRDGRYWQVAPRGSDFPSWSPDGSLIAYVDYYGMRICLVTAEGPYGCLPRQDVFVISPPAWSPDATRLAYEADGDVYVVSLSQGVANLIARNARDPSWSPDGRFIACWSPAADWRLYVYDIAGCEDLSQPCPRSVPEIGHAFQPRWSPDGSHIAFLTASRLGSVQLAALDTACLGGLRPCSESLTLLSSPEDDIHDFVWSPDGQVAAFTVRRQQRVDVYMVRLDGTGAMLVASIDGRFIPQLDWAIAQAH